jgi:hypothetical protein
MAAEKRFEPSIEWPTFLFHVKHSLFDADVDRISAEEFLRGANIWLGAFRQGIPSWRGR